MKTKPRSDPTDHSIESPTGSAAKTAETLCTDAMSGFSSIIYILAKVLVLVLCVLGHFIYVYKVFIPFQF